MAHILIPGRAISIIAIFIMLTDQKVSAIHCFKCAVIPPMYVTNETIRLCSKFDYSNKFVVDCQYSTMCMKKTSIFTLPNGEKIIGIERDCAPQRDSYQVLVNKKWEERTDIKEIYDEGCQVEDDKGARSLSPEYCYCRKYLCNSAPKEHGEVSYHVDAMAVILVFNALKYFRSMDIG